MGLNINTSTSKRINAQYKMCKEVEEDVQRKEVKIASLREEKLLSTFKGQKL